VRAVLVEKYSSIEELSVQEVPSPTVSEGDVTVRVAAAGLGFVDGLKIKGLYQTKDPLPFIPGMEFSGIVETVGDNVSKFRVGDRVFGLAKRGALAEQIVAPASGLLKIPDHITFAQAAAVPGNYLTAIFALKEVAAVRKGERILVLGAAGGTGNAAIKVGKSLGAHVFAAASSNEKRSIACAEGATGAIDYTQAGWRDALKSLTGDRPIDVIFDPIGGEISPVAFRTLGWRGRHLVVGFAAGQIPALPFNIALLKGAALIGVDSAQIQKWEPETYDQVFRDIVAGLESGTLEPPLVQTFAFKHFRDAFGAMTSRRAIGKIVVTIP
jgi:NADPH2:quinone reductase